MSNLLHRIERLEEVLEALDEEPSQRLATSTAEAARLRKEGYEVLAVVVEGPPKQFSYVAEAWGAERPRLLDLKPWLQRVAAYLESVRVGRVVERLRNREHDQGISVRWLHLSRDGSTLTPTEPPRSLPSIDVSAFCGPKAQTWDVTNPEHFFSPPADLAPPPGIFLMKVDPTREREAV